MAAKTRREVGSSSTMRIFIIGIWLGAYLKFSFDTGELMLELSQQIGCSFNGPCLGELFDLPCQFGQSKSSDVRTGAFERVGRLAQLFGISGLGRVAHRRMILVGASRERIVNFF